MHIINKIILILIFLINYSTNLSSENFIKKFNYVDKESFLYRSPSKRQVDYESLDIIKRRLQQTGVRINHFDFWEDIIANEEKGFFGYQAAKQSYRVFQDIVKIIFEEILDFEIKKDFYFFRIPLDPFLHELERAIDFLDLYDSIDDSIPNQRDQIISLNYTLFGNVDNFSQCTVCYFERNQSWFYIQYENILEFLFESLGMPSNEIRNLLEIGEDLQDFETGVIFQFFDESHFMSGIHEPYEQVNLLAYPALGAGIYNNSVSLPLSNLYMDDFPNKFDKNTSQLRLLMNTSNSLNPYSNFTIRRYDLLDPIKVKNYEMRLRKKIVSLNRDPILVKLYTNKLKDVWNVE